jgi:beta-glucanase (GH16 family)
MTAASAAGRILLLACAVGLAACGETPGPSGETATFRRADPGAWRVSSHALGRGRFDPRNVRFGPTGLTLVLPRGSLDGGELQSRTARGSGTYSARMRTAAAQGSLSAFFLYLYDRETDSSDELDFEVPAGQPYRVIVTVWRIGVKTPAAQRTVPLAFDPAAALHDYAMERDGGSVVFRVDGREVFRSDRAPTTRLRPIFNLWYPTWQDPTVPPAPGEVTVNRFAFTP